MVSHRGYVTLASIIGVFAVAGLVIAIIALLRHLGSRDHEHPASDITDLEDQIDLVMQDETFELPSHTHPTAEIPDFVPAVLALIPPATPISTDGIDFVYQPGYTGSSGHIFDDFEAMMLVVEVTDPGSPKRIWLHDADPSHRLGILTISKKTAATAGVLPTSMTEVYDLTGCTMMCKKASAVTLDDGVYFKGLELMYDGVQFMYDGTQPVMIWDRASVADPTGTAVNQAGRGLFMDVFSNLFCALGSTEFLRVVLNSTSGYQAFVITFGSGGGFISGPVLRVEGSEPLTPGYTVTGDRVWIQTQGDAWFLGANTITSDGVGQVSLNFFNTEGHINNNSAPNAASAMPNLNPAAWPLWGGSGPEAYYRLGSARFYYRRLSHQLTGTASTNAPMALAQAQRDHTAGFMMGDLWFHLGGAPGSLVYVCTDEQNGTWAAV